MQREEEPTYTKQGLLEGVQRWGKLLRAFLDSGEELEELDPSDFGAKDEDDVQGLADALAFSASAVGLDNQLLVDRFEDKIMLVRRDAIEKHRVEGRQSPVAVADDQDEDEPVYDWVVDLALRRGFKVSNVDLEEEDDPEQVKRALERASARREEADLITVKIAGPDKVTINLTGGHKLPRTVPKKLGLGRWSDAIERFVFQEEPIEQVLIEPGRVSLDEALSATHATVKEMQLDDFLRVDTHEGKVRVTRAREPIGGAKAKGSLAKEASGQGDDELKLPEGTISPDLLKEAFRRLRTTSDGGINLDAGKLAEAFRTNGPAAVLAVMHGASSDAEAIARVVNDWADRMWPWGHGVIGEARNDTGELLLRKEWATYVVDRFLHEVDAKTTDYFEITQKDRTEVDVEEDAESLRRELALRRFTDVVEVEQDGRGIALRFWPGNLDVLNAADLADVSFEKRIVEAFLASGQEQAKVESGVNLTENRRHTGFIAAAAMELGVADRLGISADAHGIRVWRK